MNKQMHTPKWVHDSDINNTFMVYPDCADSLVVARGIRTEEHARLIAAAPETAAELARVRESNAELVAALQTIADGTAMSGRTEYGWQHVIVEHQKIAEAALVKAKEQ